MSCPTAYIIALSDLPFVKIGHCTNLEKRLNDIAENARTWAHIFGVAVRDPPIVLLTSHSGPPELAESIQLRWSHFRARRSWFRLSAELRTWAMNLVEHPEAWDDIVVAPREIQRRRRGGRPEQIVFSCSRCRGDGTHRTWCPARKRAD